MEGGGLHRGLYRFSLRLRLRAVQESNPRPAHHPHNRRTSSPRGSHPEGKPLVGVGAAPAAGFAPRSREASGHRPRDNTIPVRGARWTGRSHHAFVPCLTARQPDEGNWRLGLASEDGFRPDKRGPKSEIADKRSATGRADGGSIHPRRILAQWMRNSRYAPRGAPLPLMIDRRRKVGGDLVCPSFSGEAKRRPENLRPSQGEEPRSSRDARGKPEQDVRGAGRSQISLHMNLSADKHWSGPCARPRCSAV